MWNTALVPNVTMDETTVLYPACATEADTVLLTVLSDETGVYAVFDRTSIHPIWLKRFFGPIVEGERADAGSPIGKVNYPSLAF
jgi:hypothetical protein